MGERETRRIEKHEIEVDLFLARHRVAVVVAEGAGAGTELLIGRGGIVIGRNAGADLSLPDDALSGVHACIELGPTGFRIRDLGSTNGTLVNGSQVQATDLQHGDRIALGEHILEYVQEEASDPAS